MKYALANSLSASVSGLDSDAKAYIDAIASAGVLATQAQKTSINEFIKAEKSALRWDLHKRFYLPIWANASANAICMKSLASGTFVNSPTMGVGFIKGNSSSQYFNINTTLGALGLTSSNGAYVIGVKSEPSANLRANCGALSASGYVIDFRNDSVTGRRVTWLQSDTNVFGTFDVNQRSGVIVTTRTSSLQYTIHNDTSDIGTRIYSGGLPAVNPFVMARNNNGTADLFGDSEIAFVGFSLGLSASDSRGYAASTKNLWQSCTGLTLP